MDPEPQAEQQTSPRRDARTLRAIVSGFFFFFVLIPTILFGYPGETYPSIVDWWDKGQAQLSVSSAEASLARFFGDDAVSRLFAAVPLLILKISIPLWNGLAIHTFVRLVLVVLLSGALYDLAKTAYNRVYGEPGV